MATVFDKIREDEEYIKFKGILKNIKATINHERLLNEAKILHRDRPSRNMHKIKLEPTGIYKAVSMDMSNRARLVELRASLYRDLMVLKAALDAMRNHLSAKYRNSIGEYTSTAPERKAFVERILVKGLEEASVMESTMDQLDSYIKDIDQAAFGMQKIVEVLKLLMSPTKGIVET